MELKYTVQIKCIVIYLLKFNDISLIPLRKIKINTSTTVLQQNNKQKLKILWVDSTEKVLCMHGAVTTTEDKNKNISQILLKTFYVCTLLKLLRSSLYTAFLMIPLIASFTDVNIFVVSKFIICLCAHLRCIPLFLLILFYLFRKYSICHRYN